MASRTTITEIFNRDLNETLGLFSAGTSRALTVRKTETSYSASFRIVDYDVILTIPLSDASDRTAPPNIGPHIDGQLSLTIARFDANWIHKIVEEEYQADAHPHTDIPLAARTNLITRRVRDVITNAMSGPWIAVMRGDNVTLSMTVPISNLIKKHIVEHAHLIAATIADDDARLTREQDRVDSAIYQEISIILVGGCIGICLVIAVGAWDFYSAINR